MACIFALIVRGFLARAQPDVRARSRARPRRGLGVHRLAGAFDGKNVGVVPAKKGKKARAAKKDGAGPRHG
jgi:hypothetical protein